MGSFNHTGFPSKVVVAKRDGYYIRTLERNNRESFGNEFTLAQGQLTFLPNLGDGLAYTVNGITIIGEGNQGVIRLLGTVNGVVKVLLPNYFTVQGRSSTSGALNLKLDANTPIIVETSGRGTSLNFVGVSYTVTHVPD